MQERVNSTDGTCLKDDCEGTTHARGMCQRHYIRWWKYERRPEDVVQKLLPDGTEHVHVHGYIRVMKRDHPGAHRGYVLKHRLVMEEALGRYLTAEETVRHINGDRADNRLENLELWASDHPSGQRARQLVEWARGILGKYEADYDAGLI